MTKLAGNKKKIILGLTGLAIIAAVCVFTLLFFVQKDDDGEVTFKTVSLTKVDMKQTITAAGQVTAGQSEKVLLDKKRRFLAATVEEKEIVKKGQPLVFYTDGSHTDAPSDGVVMSVHTPERGEAPGSGDFLSFRSTSELYLSITIPEDRINDMSKDDTATIKINAMPEKEFEGRLVRVNGMSNSLISEEAAKISDDADSSPDDDDADEDSDESESSDEDYEESGSYYEDDEYSDGEEGGSMAYYTVLVAFPNDGSVRPGMSANSIVTISERKDVPAIPVEAVYFDKEDKPYVNVVDGNKTRKQEITLGESDAMNVEIKDGLKSSDRIRIEYGGGRRTK